MVTTTVGLLHCRSSPLVSFSRGFRSRVPVGKRMIDGRGVGWGSWWVGKSLMCTDFIKRPSNRRKPPAPQTAIKLAGEDGGTATVRVADGGFPAVLPQPVRLSCSLP
ncbi:hypothetical protein E3N88_05374 [Mikania micrantha]|uniref:Uncharacterized protein n=1 Tax=Mikania micrantha TaxID=192012 RepID=A0A5N6PKU0_9ASTR|nr:hypothetical protein E3N88_05374 [Mikania micrantha]